MARSASPVANAWSPSTIVEIVRNGVRSEMSFAVTFQPTTAAKATPPRMPPTTPRAIRPLKVVSSVTRMCAMGVSGPTTSRGEDDQYGKPLNGRIVMRVLARSRPVSPRFGSEVGRSAPAASRNPGDKPLVEVGGPLAVGSDVDDSQSRRRCQRGEQVVTGFRPHNVDTCCRRIPRQVNAMRRPEDSLEAVDAGLGKKGEDAAAVVIDHDERQVGLRVVRVDEEAVTVMEIGEVAKQRIGMAASSLLPAQCGADRRGDQAINAVDPAVAHHDEALARFHRELEIPDWLAGRHEEQ